MTEIRSLILFASFPDGQKNVLLLFRTFWGQNDAPLLQKFIEN